MKKTQFIDLISTIRRTVVSFAAITVFIALGLAFYGGSVWGSVHTENSFTRTYQDGRMQTLLVTDPFGLTESQVSELKSIDGIDDAEGLNIVYRFFENKSGVRQQAVVIQMTENIDRLLNVEGQLPSAAGEAAVLRSWAEENNVVIGDVIELQEENASDYRQLQSVRNVAQWNGEDLSDLRISTEDPGYLVETELTVTAIVDSPVYLSTNPYAHGICSANGLYIDAVLFVSVQEMPSGAFGGYTSVALYSDELNRISCFSDSYKSRSEALSEEVQNVIDGWDRQLVADFNASVDNIRAKLDALDALYAMTGLSSPAGAGVGKMPDQQAQLEQQAQLTQPDQQAQQSLLDQLDQLRQELNGKESFSVVTGTDSNNSYLTADSLIDVLDNMRSVLGITFLAIGVMICYSVISRLVADSAVQIGTRKALGFYRLEIRRLYLSYVGMAMFLGGILGILIGVFGIEYAFTLVFAGQFTFTRIPLIFNFMDILPVFLIICGIILAVTAVACNSETRKSAILLLRGDRAQSAVSERFQKSPLLRKMSLLNQTVLVNLTRDRRRVFGMITGIAGATALITAGLTLYLNFTSAFTKQFQEYYRFDYQICYDASSGTASEEIRQVLDRHGLNCAEIYSSCFIMYSPDGKTNAPNVIVPADTEDLAKLMYFDTETGKGESYDSGLWMSDYYRYAFHAPAGSLLKLQMLDGTEAEIPVDRYYKYHLSTPVVVMDQALYRDAFGEEAAPNAFYVASDGFDMKQLADELEKIDGYIYTYNCYESFQASYLSEKLVMSAFAVLFGLTAVLLMLMTVINLMNVYLSEKKNELIILMINGYDRKFAKRYIYYDTIVLTLLGILTGLIAGTVLGNRTLTSIEGNLVRFIHGISYLSCAVSAVSTAVMTALICSQTLRKIDGFRLSDIDIGK